MPLTPAELAANRRERMLHTALKYQTSTYLSRFVAPAFQRVVRFEASILDNGYAVCVRNGEIVEEFRRSGECVCITCGVVHPWTSPGLTGMHTGHFLPSRRNSIVLEPANVAPQCSRCNRYESGKPVEFRRWMESERPNDIERLMKLKQEIRKFGKEELVDLLIGYRARLTG